MKTVSITQWNTQTVFPSRGGVNYLVSMALRSKIPFKTSLREGRHLKSTPRNKCLQWVHLAREENIFQDISRSRVLSPSKRELTLFKKPSQVERRYFIYLHGKVSTSNPHHNEIRNGFPSSARRRNYYPYCLEASTLQIPSTFSIQLEEIVRHRPRVKKRMLLIRQACIYLQSRGVRLEKLYDGQD